VAQIQQLTEHQSAVPLRVEPLLNRFDSEKSLKKFTKIKNKPQELQEE